MRLHGIREIYFQQHEDCGAVGGSSAFNGRSDELDYHRNLMVRAERIVLQRFSDPSLVLLIWFKYARKLHGESWTIIGLNSQ